MGSLLLASKVEECFKTLREVLFAFHHIYARRKGLQLKPMELGGQQYTAWKNELIMIERYILKELGFSLYNIMDHPHKYILYFIKVLNGSEELANVAWRYLNDSMRLDVSLRFEAQTIACAAIFLAARQIAFPLPEDPDTGVWWEVFGASTEHLNIICKEIMGLYNYEKLTWLEPIAEVEYLSPENCAKFDALLADEEVVIAAPTPAPQASGLSNIEPFACRESSSSRANDASATGEGTPRVGDADRSLTATPVLDSSSSRAVLGAAEEDGGSHKLQRKWVSVMGDIDQLDVAAGSAKGTSSTTVPVAPAPAGSSRASVERREEERGHSRSHEHGARADSRDCTRDRSREKQRESRRGDSRREDSRERSRRGESRDRRQDRDSRAASGNDRDGRARRDSSRDRDTSRRDGDRRGRDDSRDRGRDNRRRDPEGERRKDRDKDRERERDGNVGKHDRSRDDDRDGRRKRGRSRSASPVRR